MSASMLVMLAVASVICFLLAAPFRTPWLLAGAGSGLVAFLFWRAGLLGQAKGMLAAPAIAAVGWLLSRTPIRADEPSREFVGASGGFRKEGGYQGEGRLLPEQGPGFAAVAGMSALKGQLLEIAKEAFTRGSTQVRNGVLLSSDPGNGKTFLVQALAEQLKLPLVTVTYSEVSSKWLGEMAEKLQPLIRNARANAPCILFFDEADSLFQQRRSESYDWDRESERVTNSLLTEFVNLRGQGVLLIAATNFPDKLDAAATREGRFDFKIHIPNPDKEGRIGLLKAALAKHARDVKVAPNAIESAAARWAGFSVKRILAVGEQTPAYVRRTGKRELTFDDLQRILREVQGAAALPPAGTKSLDELVLKEDQRRQLKKLAARLQHAFDVEQAGGKPPTGLLFSGPPGTGKTETARALAKASGYAFLPTTGNDLIGDTSKMDKIYRDAKNLRPAIVFVDEADDLLADRASSPYKSAANKFLTIVDGAGERIPDLLWIAATNFPEGLDSAALRGGRFTEKVEFSAPEADAIAPWIADWLKSKRWKCEIPAQAIAQMLDGQSMANVAEVLQQAINEAVTDSPDFKADTITGLHLERAARTVLGGAI